MPWRDEERTAGGLVGSLVLHALFIGVLTAVASLFPPPPSPPPRPEGPDRGAATGDTFDVDGLDGELRGGRGEPEVPAPARAPAAEEVPAPARAPAAQEAPPPRAPPPPRPPAPTAFAPAVPVAAASSPPSGPGAATSTAAAPSGSTAVASAAGPGASAAPLGSSPVGARGTGPGAGSGRHGALDAPAGYQNIAKAFMRVIPAATSGHAGWAQEPLGKLATFTVRITVDADGKITDLAYPADARPLVRAMLESARILLQAGQFAFWGDSIAGTETLLLDLSLEQREPTEQIALGHELPTPDRPGRAYFTLPSGRHFELKVALVAPGSAPRPARGSR